MTFTKKRRQWEAIAKADELRFAHLFKPEEKAAPTTPQTNEDTAQTVSTSGHSEARP
jgi:hypothetical protein